MKKFNINDFVIDKVFKKLDKKAKKEKKSKFDKSVELEAKKPLTEDTIIDGPIKIDIIV